MASIILDEDRSNDVDNLEKKSFDNQSAPHEYIEDEHTNSPASPVKYHLLFKRVNELLRTLPLRVGSVFKSLSILDRLLTPFILLAMILGVLIGVYAPDVQGAFNKAEFHGVSGREYLLYRMWYR